MTVKRSGREGRWADLPSARVRFGIEAAFLLIVAGGAALAKLSPGQIIMLMFVAWLLVALIERASSRTPSRPVAQHASPGAPEEPRSTERRWSWRRKREEPEAIDPTASLEEHPAPTHVRKLEPEPVPSETEPTEVAPDPPAPTVTKRALDLSGLEEPQAAPPPPPPPEPETAPAAVEPPREPPPPPAVQQPAAQPAPREWNIWELERQAREHAGDAARSEEWTALFVHLREFASTEGLLPKEFDGLVRESFAELIPAA
jgi:hypothetical protein